MIASCGGTAGNPGQSVSVLAISTTATDAAGTAEIDTTETQSGSPPQTERMIYDFRRQVGEILPSRESQGGNWETILDGSTSYVDLNDPNSLGPVPHSKRWLRITAPSLKGVPRALAALEPTDSGNLLRDLIPIARSIRKVGPSVIDGDPTTLYEVSIDLGAFRSLLGASQNAPIRAAGPFRIWIDSQNRVRQLQWGYTATGIGTATVTSVYKNFGLPVQVSIPPGSDTETIQQLQSDFCHQIRTTPTSGVINYIDLFGQKGAGPSAC